MAKLEGSIDYVLENEGGFVIDSGGPTNFGVVRADVAAYRKIPIDSITTEDMKALTKFEATEIYRNLFWKPLNLNGVHDQPIATAIFDIGVNRGISVGAKYAQRVCNLGVYNLALDGKIGYLTLQAINNCLPATFIEKLEALDFAAYEAIIAAHPSYEIYRKGWEARAKRLLTLI